ncbi:MAG: translocation/assembly module TamB domain-containing protein [Pseudacidovorax sp.]|nr:translocation/assembly module TamB domain-containing protein [Pseudacidovorax sp.]
MAWRRASSGCTCAWVSASDDAVSTDTPPPPTPQRPTTPPTRSRTRRVLRGLAWTVVGLLALVLVLLGAAWWWAGNDSSLATALTRAARYLPAGQTLETQEVTGSLRKGGRIGLLRYRTPDLTVEVHQAEIGWQLRPLFDRRVQLGEVRAAQVLIEAKPAPADAPKKPLQPLERLVLPVVEVDVPFRIGEVRWAGPPPVVAQQLAGHYRYQKAEHRLDLDGVDIEGGHYSGQVQLQGDGPMALNAALQGRLQAPLGDGRTLPVQATATAKGNLAGVNARLAVQAEARAEQADEKAGALYAKLDANLAPWAPQPVIDALATLRDVNVATFWKTGPLTRLSGEVAVQPDPPTGEQAWRLRADLRNVMPGPWDQQRLPVERLRARIGYAGPADGTWTVDEAHVEAGHGRIDAQGSWKPAPAPWQVQARIDGVRPGELHTALEGGAISGPVTARQEGDVLRFDTDLRAQGGRASAQGLQGFGLERLLARGQYNLRTQLAELPTLRVEAEGASIEGHVRARVAEQAGSGDLRVVLPGVNARLQADMAPARGTGQAEVQLQDAARLQAWLQKLPGLANINKAMTAEGGARLDARWSGGWRSFQERLAKPTAPLPRGSAEPSLNARLSTPQLLLKPGPAADGTRPVPLQLTAFSATIDGSLARANLALSGDVQQGERRARLDTTASGGLEAAGQWRLALARLRADLDDGGRDDTPWVLELGQGFETRVRQAGDRLQVETTAGSATVRGPVPGTVRLSWEPIRLSSGHSGVQLQTKGRLQGLPMAWSRAFGGDTSLRELGISGDLVFDGDWDIAALDQLRARVRLGRASGDLRVQAGEAALVRKLESHGTGAPGEVKTDSSDSAPSTPAGLRQAELRLDAEGDTVRASLDWDSQRAGRIQANASTRLQRQGDGWQWPADAPLAGRLQASLPQLGVWSMLAPPGWRIAGTLEADATLGGQRNDPRWNGTVRADQLALKAAVEGLDLRDGRLRATLAGNRVVIEEFRLQGGPGSRVRIPGRSGNLSTNASQAAQDGGSLSMSGELGWGPASAGRSGLSMSMRGEIRSLRALVRSDRQLTLSGQLQAGLQDGQIRLRGDLTADRAVIILPDESAPSLGSDVVVHSAARDAQERKKAEAAEVSPQQPTTARPPDIQVSFDLGRDFAVQGRGITTRLEGKLDIRATSTTAPPRVTGEIRTVQGQYRAYGQALDVESGIVRFNGPVDNPQLDILALRPNISQRAGVQITGSAQAPRVKLYSDPPLSDAEVLSWVVLGRASAASGGEAQLMQQAALALLGRLGAGGEGGSLASRFGLDEIGFKGGGNGDVAGSAITLGKRLSDDFYVTYERSLAGTLGTIYFFYDLTRNLTLRGQAGIQSGIDLIYTVQYD